jgi:hypothetical protein
MPLPYRKVSDLYEKLRESGATQATLPDWSHQMNQELGTDLFDEGVNDNIIKRTSVGIDRLLESTGLPHETAKLGADFGELLGNREAGRVIGEKIPRSLVNFAPMLATRNVGGLLAMAGLSGTETYTETGSPAAGLVSAATAAAMPKVAELGEQEVLKRFGGKLLTGPLANKEGRVTEQLSRYFPETIAQGVKSQVAGQVAATGFGESARALEAGLTPDDPNNPRSVYKFSPTETLLNMTLGQLPFAALYLTKHGKAGLGGQTTEHLVRNIEADLANSQKNIDLRNAREALATKSPIEKIPTVEVTRVDPKVLKEQQSLLAQLRGQQIKVKDDSNLTPEQKVEQMNTLLRQESLLMKERESVPVSPQSIFGDSIAPDAPREQVVGRTLRETPGARAVFVEDFPVNPENLRGKVVWYSKAYEPNPTQRSDGTTVFGLPDVQWRTVRTREEWQSRFPKRGDNTPELPVQPTEATREQMFAHIADLQRVENDVEEATTTGDLHQAVTRLNSVQDEAGLPQTNDASLRKTAKLLQDAGLNDPADVAKKAVAIEAKKTARKITTRETERGVAPLTEDQAALISAKMEEGGFSIITADKLSHTKEVAGDGSLETEARNLVPETAIRVSLSDDGRKVFDSWERKGETTLQQEQQMFYHLTDEYGTLSDVTPEEAAKTLSERIGMSEVEARDEFKDFITRPHVKVWEMQLESELARMRSGNAAPEPQILISKGLEKEIAHKLNVDRDPPEAGESLYDRADAIQELMQDMDFPEHPASQFKKELEDYGASIGVFKPYSKAQIDEIVTTGGKKYDFKRGDKYFRFESWEPLKENVRAPVLPYVPEPEDHPRIAELGIDGGGEGLRQFLLKSGDSFYRALGKDLEKFGSSLQRVTAKIAEVGVSAHARNIGNGRVEIEFSPAILSAMDANYYVAHELVHGLSIAELDNPTKAPIVGEITKLRERLIEALPRDLRKIYDDAVKSDWYNRYTRGELKDTGGLSPDYKKGAIVYSLFTNHELLAQGLTDPHVRTFMQGVKTDGKSWFSRFTNVVKRLVGLGETIPDTAFEEFLSKTDALLQHSEHVNDFLNYSNRYFENLGYSQGLVNAQTRRAMGLVLDSVNGTTPEAMFATLQQSPIIRSTELIKANREVTKMLQEKGDDFQVFSSVMDELGHNVDVRGLNDFAYETLVNGENHDAIDLLPDAAAKYLFAQAKDVADVVGVLKAATSEKNQGLINLTDAKALRLPVGQAMKQLDKLLSVSKMHDLAMEQMQGLFAVTPDGYLDKLVNDPVRAPEWIDDADKTKRKVFWFKNFLQPISQAAREDPRMAELATKGFQLTSNSRKMASEGLKMFGIDPDQLGKGNVLSKAAVERTEKIFKNPKLTKAVNDWIFLNQKMGQKTGTTVIRPMSDPEVAAMMNKLNQEERTQVQEIVAKQQISMQMMHAQQLEKMLQISASDAAVLIGADTALKTGQNIQLAESLLKAAVVDRNNPLEVAAFIKEHGTDMDTQVSLVQQRLEPEVFNRLLKYSMNEAEKHNAWKQFFADNPAWASGQRYGKYLVEYKRGNRTFLAGVESRKEAESLAEGGQITKFEANRKYDEDTPPNLGPDAVSMITRLRELEQNRIEMLKDKMTPDQIEELQRFSPVEQLVTEEAYRGGVPDLRPPARGLRKGAEELPWLSNHFSWVQKTSSFWSRQLLRAQARAHLLDPEISQDRELQKRLKTHIDNMLASDPELASKLSRFTTTWFMGYNPASALINGTQSFVTHVAEFTSLTGKPLESYRRVMDAMAELRDAKTGRKGFRGEEHERLMTEAAKDGEIDYSMFDTDAAAQESIHTNYKRILNGQRPQTLGQRLTTASGVYTTAGMWMFRGVEKFNNQLALLASFDYYRSQGLDYSDAKAQAYEFNRTVNYGGGRAQRPVGAFSGRGAFARGAAVTMTALQNYTLGTTFQIARYLQRGFFRPEGTTPAERHNARIAATQMLVTQLAAAGVLGLPFVSGAIALLDGMFPGLELNKNLREKTASLFQSDKENGSVLGDIAMTGAPSMFGWDLQSRLSMGNTVPGVSEVNGFQPELLLGPPANLIGSFVKGVRRVAGGDLGGLQSFLPSALKKPVQTVASGGTVKDYRDRPLFQPTVGESVGLALGFQPKRLSDYNAAARIAEQSQTVASRRVGQERQALAEEVLKGNFGSVRQTLLAKAQEDKSYNPAEEVRAIARASEELTFPRDLRREGSRSTSSERERLLQSFNLPPNSTSEVARLQFRWQIQQRLGLPAGSKAELQRAQVIDQLRQQDPNATRSELSRRADLLLRRRPGLLQEPGG